MTIRNFIFGGRRIPQIKERLIPQIGGDWEMREKTDIKRSPTG